jgi:hypothetical protein
MFDNNTYNLMAQMVEEHKSLYRIKNYYKEDARDCEECKAFWDKLEIDKEKHISDLRELIQNHFAQGEKKKR